LNEAEKRRWPGLRVNCATLLCEVAGLFFHTFFERLFFTDPLLRRILSHGNRNAVRTWSVLLRQGYDRGRELREEKSLGQRYPSRDICFGESRDEMISNVTTK